MRLHHKPVTQKRVSSDNKNGINKLLVDRNLFMKTSYAATDVIHNNLGSATRVVRNIIHD